MLFNPQDDPALPKGWYANWDPSNDLSIGGKELSFREPNAFLYLVETQAVRDVRELAENVSSPNISPRHYLVGQRGYGKSTLLNLMAHILFQSFGAKRVLPIHCTIREASGGIGMTFFQSMLEALLNVPCDVRILFLWTLIFNLKNSLRSN